MELKIFADTSTLATAVADEIVELIAATLQIRDRFTFVLSGGSTPKKLYELLASDAYRDRVDWKSVHFFWGDERHVPFTDDRNNAKMAFSTLLDHLPVVHSQIHVMRTDLPADESSLLYEELLRDYFGTEPVHSFDLVLLGMGPDGHTLSLFPHFPIVREQHKWVDSFFLTQQDMFRVTLTAPITNLSRNIFFLVAGADKAHALKQVLEGEPQADEYPSQLIRPTEGRLVWFVDGEAAREVRGER
jgi:6-phosphogluconolactonase